MRTWKYICKDCHSNFEIRVSELQRVQYMCCPVCGSPHVDLGEREHDNVLSFADWIEIMNGLYKDLEPIQPTEYDKWHSEYQEWCREHGMAYEVRE